MGRAEPQLSDDGGRIERHMARDRSARRVETPARRWIFLARTAEFALFDPACACTFCATCLTLAENFSLSSLAYLVPFGLYETVKTTVS